MSKLLPLPPGQQAQADLRSPRKGVHPGEAGEPEQAEGEPAAPGKSSSG